MTVRDFGLDAGDANPALPQDVELDIDRTQDGVVSVSFTSGIQPVKYEFTEA